MCIYPVHTKMVLIIIDFFQNIFNRGLVFKAKEAADTQNFINFKAYKENLSQVINVNTVVLVN